MTGKSIIFSAPSGAGKTTIVKHLLSLDLQLEFSVSACSRPPRENEKEGRDYYFMSVPEFRKNIEQEAYVEWEEVYRPIDDNAPLVVLMKLHPTLATHAGVYIGNNRILHTTKGTGAIVTRVDALPNRIVGYYRPCSK